MLKKTISVFFLNLNFRLFIRQSFITRTNSVQLSNIIGQKKNNKYILCISLSDTVNFDYKLNEILLIFMGSKQLSY